MKWGTSHFESKDAAISYYRPYGYSNTAQAVERKLADGEIHIGKPEAKPGQTVTLNREEGRYFIEEAERQEQSNRKVNHAHDNPDCCGNGPHIPGEVRVMPTGGDGNLILCSNCWDRELDYRRDRNRDLADFAKFDLPSWWEGKVYGAE
ncbi:MAG: hypothetical protein B7Z80_08705 [Rhodospirillales bacterium 20-64-7]|nr:MAG: hypothetical protein B7Z80_08705 [Rhodospirillales bacterium 20-64-7]